MDRWMDIDIDRYIDYLFPACWVGGDRCRDEEYVLHDPA